MKTAKVRTAIPILIGLAVVIFGINLTFCEENKEAQSTPTSISGPHPKIKFTQLEYDFGDMYQNESRTWKARFVNEGDAVLKIDRIRASCGCTAAIVSSQEIKPGEAGEIEVTFNSGKFKGEKIKTVDVFSNDPENPTVQLKIKANVKVEVDVEPPRIFLSKVERDNIPSQEVTIKGYMSKPLKIEKIESTSEFLKTELLPQPDGTYKLKINFDKNIPVGRFNGIITLFTNSEKDPRTEINIYAQIEGDLTISPERVFFTNLAPGDKPTQTVTITSKKGTNFKIESATDLDGLVNVSVENTIKGKEYLIKVSPKPDLPQEKIQHNRFMGTIKIKTNHQEQPEIELPYTGFLRVVPKEESEK